MMRTKGFCELIFDQYRSASICAVVRKREAEISGKKLNARSQNVSDGPANTFSPRRLIFIPHWDLESSKDYSSFMWMARYG